MANPFFNAQYYLEQNDDVAAATGGDAAIAEQHYFLHGAREAADDINVARKPAPWFDIQFYRDSNAKLADVPADQLFLHFTLHGMREGLSPMEGVELDAQAYADANPELVAALGIENAAELSDDDILLLNQHFYAHGYREGLEGGPSIPGYTPGGPSTLTEALDALLQAEANKVTYLEEEAAEIKAVADLLSDDPDAAEIEAAVGTAYANAITAVNTEADTVAPISADRSDAYNKALIEEQQAINAERLEKAEAAVAKVDGLSKAVNAVLAAQAATGAAEDEQEVTSADAFGATARFGVINGVAVADATYNPPLAGAVNVASVVVLDGDDVISIDADGKLVITPAGEDLDGIEELLAAIQADFNAINAIQAAQNNEAAANAVVRELENPALAEAVETAEANVTAFATLAANYEAAATAYAGATVPTEAQEQALVTAYAALTEYDSTDFPAIVDTNTSGTAADEISAADGATTTAIGTEEAALDGALTAAEGALAAATTPLTNEMVAASNEVEAFDKAVNEYLAAKATAEDLQGYNDAIDTAIEGIEELGYVVDDNGVGSADNDVFIFSGEDASITGFGAQGDDVLYIGDSFTEARLEAGVDIATTRQGDAATLEVFIQQQGNDAVIYLEGQPFEGSATNGFEGSTITLVGVSADSLQLENGAISIVEVA